MSILERIKELNDINDLDIPDNYKESILHMVMKLQEYPVVKDIILFGSCVRGEVQNNSDIDIAVVVEKELSPQEEWDIDEASRHQGHCLPCDVIFIPQEIFNRSIEGETIIRPLLREGLRLNELLFKR